MDPDCTTASEKTESATLFEGIKCKCVRIANGILFELGIAPEDLKSFNSFTALLHSPCDPSSLSIIRIFYGFLMMIDVLHERGLSSADSRWGNPLECRFPFFHFLHPLSLEWMILVYFIMFIGTVGILLGYRYRLSCLCFLVPYWYIFFLDKTHWNNHSYLFGLIGIQLMISGADRCWSLDAILNPEIRNIHVPLWNYALLRGQIFLVYFIAGLKKTNLDWIGGYSMEKLGYHWVFHPFRILLTGDQVTYFIVHLGGFLLDLTVGFFMLLKFSRPYAFAFCGLFNLMNSRMFSIGMFPYVMIAIMPIFCSPNWPKKFLSLFPKAKLFLLDKSIPNQSCFCIYKEQETNKKLKGLIRKKFATSGVNTYNRTTAIAFCCYFFLQGFLPYSHFLTSGYNTWTQGLYGYSWDMMVNNWRYVHTIVTVVDKVSGQHMHLDPEAWTRTHRWTHHADMVKQFAYCIEERMATYYNLKNIEVYIDVWLSLNRRFTQRMYDPSVDILKAKWSPFKEVSWVLPLQTELTEWRENLILTEEKFLNQTEDVNVVFITDFPGFHLINYIGDHLKNTTLQVMRGTIEVQVMPGKALQIFEGESFEIPSGTYHRISPIKYKPACYMYVYYANNFAVPESRSTKNYLLQAATCSAERHEVQVKPTSCIRGFCWEKLPIDFMKEFQIWSKSVGLVGRAVYSIWTGKPMIDENIALKKV